MAEDTVGGDNARGVTFDMIDKIIADACQLTANLRARCMAAEPA